MRDDIRKAGIRHVDDVQATNRELLERALHMRCVSYLAQEKAKLLTLTIGELDRSRRAATGRASALRVERDDLTREKDAAEVRNLMLEELHRTLEDRVRERTAALEASNRELVREIQERKRAEEERERLWAQLLHAQKMEVLGQLAAGVAHDFNNLLGVIGGFAELALGRLDPESFVAEDLGAIREATQRAVLLSRQLLAFSRKQPAELCAVSLVRVVEGLGKLLRRTLGDEITLELALEGAEGLNVRGDSAQLELLLLNLAVNARDAMPRGGRLTIRVRRGPEGGPGPEAEGGDVAIVEVTDTGEGIDPELHERIFEPFFTTKGPAHGTGLGLATVREVAVQHGGSVTVRSAPGKGTTFLVRLPLTAEVAEERQVVRPAVLPRGRECVLVVDDEHAIRRLIRETLAPLGYEVLEAGRADEALALLRSGERTVDLLLTDFFMPEVNGLELAQIASQLKPRLRVVLMTARGSEAISAALERGGGLGYVSKPFSPAHLAIYVRRILDRAA